MINITILLKSMIDNIVISLKFHTSPKTITNEDRNKQIGIGEKRVILDASIRVSKIQNPYLFKELSISIITKVLNAIVIGLGDVKMEQSMSLKRSSWTRH